MTEKVVIRKAVINDLPAITDIYNDEVINSVATFDTKPKTIKEQQEWFIQHQHNNPVLVAEENGQVVGWVSLSQWSDRCAYADTAEFSIYVHKNHRGKGVGRHLLAAIIEEAKRENLHTIVARIESSNDAIVHLCKIMGFSHVGIMKEVGRKFNRLLDVVIMQRIL